VCQLERNKMDLRYFIEKMDAIEANENLQEATAFQFSPEQEKWLGGANRQDPYILNRMPGAKPPVTYFTDPADQELAKRMGFPATATPAPATTPAPVTQVPPEQSGQPAVDNAELLAKLKRLEELVDKYNNLKNKSNESNINISESLIESFGYTINEEGAWDTVKRVGGKLFSKVAFPVAAGMAIWDGWTQIQALPPSMSEEEKTKETRKIISKLVAEFGTFYVGAIIGGAIGGVIGGVGAIPGFIAGGIASSLFLGDDVNKIVDKIIDYLHKDNKPPSSPSVTTQEPPANQEPAKQQSVNGDSDIIELQTALQKSGATNQDGTPLTIDGIMGPNTVRAIQIELAGLGATNQDGTPLTIDGKLGPNTASAIQKYYLS
jgi:hypothetical protein